MMFTSQLVQPPLYLSDQINVMASAPCVAEEHSNAYEKVNTAVSASKKLAGTYIKKPHIFPDSPLL